jgi:predicted DNA-binding protein
MKKKRAMSVRLSPEAAHLLKTMAQEWGVTEAAVIEIALRRLAEEVGKRNASSH